MLRLRSRFISAGSQRQWNKNFSLRFWEAVNIVSLCPTCDSWFSREALHSRTSPGDTRKLQELPPAFDTCYFLFNLAFPKAKDSSVFFWCWSQATTTQGFSFDISRVSSSRPKTNSWKNHLNLMEVKLLWMQSHSLTLTGSQTYALSFAKWICDLVAVYILPRFLLLVLQKFLTIGQVSFWACDIGILAY